MVGLIFRESECLFEQRELHSAENQHNHGVNHKGHWSIVGAANQEILHFVQGDSPREKKAPYQKYGAF